MTAAERAARHRNRRRMMTTWAFDGREAIEDVWSAWGTLNSLCWHRGAATTDPELEAANKAILSALMALTKSLGLHRARRAVRDWDRQGDIRPK